MTKPAPAVYGNPFDGSDNPFGAPAFKTETGHYQKTNIRTKKGLWVFQWMGWEGEVIAR